MQVLVVVDMQNDFIDGALGTKEAQAIVPAVVRRIRAFDGPVFFTRDTHQDDYLESQEGRQLPVPHCIRGSEGWQLRPEIAELVRQEPIDKPTFGSVELGKALVELNGRSALEGVTLVGLCTDICVISNALLVKAFLPEVPVFVDSACCAGVSPESHRRALEAMAACQIQVL